MKSNIDKIGFGTAAIGRPLYINIKKESLVNEAVQEFSLSEFQDKGRAILEKAYRAGVRYFDTAPGYGMAEQLLIDWLSHKNDASISVATKWGYTYVADFALDAIRHEVKEHSLAKLNEQWEQSKKLLPFLKVYQIHSATLETGVLENDQILKRLDEIKKEYGVLIGITSTGATQLEVIQKAVDVEVNGDELFDVFQVSYNIFDQSLAVILPVLNKRGKKIIIKEALANGRVFENDDYPHYIESYDVLKSLAKKYGVGIDAIALRFCIDSIHSDVVLSGAAVAEHLIDNIKSETFKLEVGEVEVLKKLSIDPKEYWDERKKLGWN